MFGHFSGLLSADGLGESLDIIQRPTMRMLLFFLGDGESQL